MRMVLCVVTRQIDPINELSSKVRASRKQAANVR